MDALALLVAFSDPEPPSARASRLLHFRQNQPAIIVVIEDGRHHRHHARCNGLLRRPNAAENRAWFAKSPVLPASDTATRLVRGNFGFDSRNPPCEPGGWASPFDQFVRKPAGPSSAACGVVENMPSRMSWLVLFEGLVDASHARIHDDVAAFWTSGSIAFRLMRPTGIDESGNLEGIVHTWRPGQLGRFR